MTAASLAFTDGANISSSTFGPGRGGTITITAGSLTLTEGAQIVNRTLGPGRGGTITITATESLTLAGTSPDDRFSSAIVAQAEGRDATAGAAGTIQVTAASLTLTDGGRRSPARPLALDAAALSLLPLPSLSPWPARTGRASPVASSRRLKGVTLPPGQRARSR